MCFYRASGKAFKVYDYGCSCETLLEELEMRGVEVDIPGRVFGASGIAASHPCPDRRHFTVRFTAWSVHAVGRLEVKGREISVHRWCRLPRYLTKPRQRRSEWDMAGSDGISRVSAVFRGKLLLTNKIRII